MCVYVCVHVCVSVRVRVYMHVCLRAYVSARGVCKSIFAGCGQVLQI